MTRTDQQFLEFKKSLEKDHDKELSDEEVQKAIDLVEFLAEVAVDIVMKEAGRNEKLKGCPKGFHLEEGGTCTVCGEYATGENSWFDKDGIKCIACQQAINKRIIPRSLGKHKDSFYTAIELDIFFNLKGRILNSFIRQGLLKERAIPGINKGRHLRVFLLKDNKGFLPPKKLLSSQWVRDERDGKEEYAFMPWYYFHDPTTYLKKYKISTYLKLVTLESK